VRSRSGRSNRLRLDRELHHLLDRRLLADVLQQRQRVLDGSAPPTC
jgi:hypothetical protein